MQKKNLYLSVLCLLFFFVPLASQVGAQGVSGSEKYYSNPKEGIYPTLPKPYSDESVIQKTDDLSVELECYQPDTAKLHDSLMRILEDGTVLNSGLKNAELTNEIYWQIGNPRYWGWTLYYSWDPWYSPWWNGWYYPGWGGSYWHGCCYPYVSIGWGWSPYWSIGWGWSPWWDYGWPWYWGYPYYYAWGAYTWGGPYPGYHPSAMGGNGHRYIGGGGRTTASRTSTRSSTAVPTTSRSQTARRGGVDVGRTTGRLERPDANRNRITTQTVRNRGDNSSSRSNLQSRSGYGNNGRSIENGYRTTFDRQTGNRSYDGNNRNNSRISTERRESGNGNRTTSSPSRSSRSFSAPSRSSGCSFGGSRGGSLGGSSRGRR